MAAAEIALAAAELALAAADTVAAAADIDPAAAGIVAAATLIAAAAAVAAAAAALAAAFGDMCQTLLHCQAGGPLGYYSILGGWITAIFDSDIVHTYLVSIQYSDHC